jgi:hypothetical protein
MNDQRRLGANFYVLELDHPDPQFAEAVAKALECMGISRREQSKLKQRFVFLTPERVEGTEARDWSCACLAAYADAVRPYKPALAGLLTAWLGSQHWEQYRPAEEILAEQRRAEDEEAAEPVVDEAPAPQEPEPEGERRGDCAGAREQAAAGASPAVLKAAAARPGGPIAKMTKAEAEKMIAGLTQRRVGAGGPGVGPAPRPTAGPAVDVKKLVTAQAGEDALEDLRRKAAEAPALIPGEVQGGLAGAPVDRARGRIRKPINVRKGGGAFGE